MSDPLAWTGAIGGAVAAGGAVIATIGAWRTEATARWQARAERQRTDQARKENELHRMRHKQLYDWWHDMPDGLARVRAMHWFGEWTGARDPYHGSDQGAIPPGFGCRGANDAYDRYIGFLDAIFHPGRLGPPRKSLAAPGETEDATEPKSSSQVRRPVIEQPGPAKTPAIAEGQDLSEQNLSQG